MRQFLPALALLILLPLLGPLPAAAHGLFWEKGPTEAQLMEGHTAGAGHGGGAASHPVGSELITLHQVLLPGSESWTAIPVLDGQAVTAPAATAAIFTVIDWNWWVKTRQGSQQAHPDSTGGVLKAWHSVETLRQIDHPHPLALQARSQGLEILPAEDPLALKPGQKLELQVLLDGQPIADVPVAYQGEVRGQTDSKGRVRLKMRQAGVQTFQATWRAPDPDRPHAQQVRSATLVFNLEER